MWMTYFVILLMALGYLAVVVWPGLAAIYAQYCTSLLAATTIYTGGNAAVKWMGTKIHPDVFAAHQKAAESDSTQPPSQSA
jgi:hypothetical protein